MGYLIKRIIKEELGWGDFSSHDEVTTITNFIKREIPKFFTDHPNHITIIELEGGEIYTTWSKDYEGVDYDMFETDYFIEFSEMRHTQNIIEGSLDSFIESISEDFDGDYPDWLEEQVDVLGVRRLKKEYTDKLKEIIPIKRTFVFENLY